MNRVTFLKRAAVALTLCTYLSSDAYAAAAAADEVVEAPRAVHAQPYDITPYEGMTEAELLTLLETHKPSPLS